MISKWGDRLRTAGKILFWLLLAVVVIVELYSVLIQSTFPSTGRYYLYSVSRVGERVSLNVLSSPASRSHYSFCTTLDHEQEFIDLIGKTITLHNDGGFSLLPFWMGCANPVEVVSE